MFRLFERMVNWRAKYLGVIDGDLGLFVSRDAFMRAGGFDDLPWMEDICFSKKLRKYYYLAQIPSVIEVSGRRWREEGFLKTFWKYTLAYLHLWSGFVFLKGTTIESSSHSANPHYFCQRT